MTSTSRHSDRNCMTLPRRVRHHSDGTFAIEGDTFVELDRTDPRLRQRDSGGDTLYDLHVGESAWTVPWAMWRDVHSRWWLHPDYEVDSSPGGTVEMLVEHRADGYHVRYPPLTKHEWPAKERPGHGSTFWIPVKRRRWLRWNESLDLIKHREWSYR